MMGILFSGRGSNKSGKGENPRSKNSCKCIKSPFINYGYGRLYNLALQQ